MPRTVELHSVPGVASTGNISGLVSGVTHDVDDIEVRRFTEGAEQSRVSGADADFLSEDRLSVLRREPRQVEGWDIIGDPVCDPVMKGSNPAQWIVLAIAYVFSH